MDSRGRPRGCLRLNHTMYAPSCLFDLGFSMLRSLLWDLSKYRANPRGKTELARQTQGKMVNLLQRSVHFASLVYDPLAGVDRRDRNTFPPVCTSTTSGLLSLILAGKAPEAGFVSSTSFSRITGASSFSTSTAGRSMTAFVLVLA